MSTFCVEFKLLLKSKRIDFDTAALHIMLNRDYFRPKTRFKMAVRRVIDEVF